MGPSVARASAGGLRRGVEDGGFEALEAVFYASLHVGPERMDLVAHRADLASHLGDLFADFGEVGAHLDAETGDLVLDARHLGAQLADVVPYLFSQTSNIDADGREIRLHLLQEVDHAGGVRIVAAGALRGHRARVARPAAVSRDVERLGPGVADGPEDDVQIAGQTSAHAWQ
jgi:hypothetical protein